MGAQEIRPIQGLHDQGFVDFRPIPAEQKRQEAAEVPLGVPESVTSSPPDPSPSNQLSLEEEVARMEREKLSPPQTSATLASAEKDNTPQSPNPPLPGS